MFEGEKILIFLGFFSFYFLIIFLDDFISKKGVGERRRTEGGRTRALSRAERGRGRREGGEPGAQGPGKTKASLPWAKWGPVCPDHGCRQPRL